MVCETFPDPGPLPSSDRAVSLRKTTLNSNLRVNAADWKSSDVLHWTTYIWTTSDFIKDVELIERQSTKSATLSSAHTDFIHRQSGWCLYYEAQQVYSVSLKNILISKCIQHPSQTHTHAPSSRPLMALNQSICTLKTPLGASISFLASFSLQR